MQMTPFHITDLFDDVDDLNSCTGKFLMNLLRSNKRTSGVNKCLT